jgi:two-component system response regulator QseB
MRILLVEDDDLIGSGVEAGLRHANFAVDWTQDGRNAQLALETTDYALVVLDLGLPRMSGLELLGWLRGCGKNVPVLVLTAKGTVADKVGGLEAGADDYLGKPFDLTELIARCRALLRRSNCRSGRQDRIARRCPHSADCSRMGRAASVADAPGCAAIQISS